MHLFNTLFTSPQDPENLYCKRSCTGTCFSIHLLPSIWHFCSQPLMFRINFRSIAKDSYSPPSFSEINRCLIFFELFLPYIHFISFSFFISLLFFLFISCFMFQTFVVLFIAFRLLFRNIFEYLYVHSCICSITVLQNNKVLLHSAI